LDIVLCP
jgi:hypothetical protein